MVPVIDQGRVFCMKWVSFVNRAERIEFPEKDLLCIDRKQNPAKRND